MTRASKKRRKGASRLTHLDERGRARMVDVSDKALTLREAIAAGAITMNAEAYAAIRQGTLVKGDAAAMARLAGIAAAKRTAEMIPLCHAIPLDHVGVEVRFDDRERAIEVEATARTRWSTGVEMEALVAVSASLLTIYDMGKGIDRSMTLGSIRLLRKSGGRSGTYVRETGRGPIRGRRGRP
jgi:cyclic pyranopterin phosphate synthase